MASSTSSTKKIRLHVILFKFEIPFQDFFLNYLMLAFCLCVCSSVGCCKKLNKISFFQLQFSFFSKSATNYTKQEFNCARQEDCDCDSLAVLSQQCIHARKLRYMIHLFLSKQNLRKTFVNTYINGLISRRNKAQLEERSHRADFHD